MSSEARLQVFLSLPDRVMVLQGFKEEKPVWAPKLSEFRCTREQADMICAQVSQARVYDPDVEDFEEFLHGIGAELVPMCDV